LTSHSCGYLKDKENAHPCSSGQPLENASERKRTVKLANKKIKVFCFFSSEKKTLLS
jgi:hypothetical protein